MNLPARKVSYLFAGMERLISSIIIDSLAKIQVFMPTNQALKEGVTLTNGTGDKQSRSYQNVPQSIRSAAKSVHDHGI